MSDKASIRIEATGKKAVIKMTGPVGEWNATMFEEQLDAAVKSGVKDFLIMIDSVGGSVIAASRIASILDKLPKQPNCEIGALCASAATYNALKCKKRTMASNGLFMIHKPSLNFQGNVDQMASQMKALEMVTGDYKKLYATVTGKSEEDIEKLWRDEYWMDAKEAKQLGFITHIADPVRITSQVAEDLKTIDCPGDILNRIAASIDTSQKSHIQYHKMELKVLTATLGANVPGLTGLAENATEAQFAAKISEALSAKDQEIQTLKTQIEDDNKAKVTAAVQAAVADGRITKDQQPKWEKMLTADFETAHEMLSGLSKRIDINAAITPGASASQDNSRKDWDYSRWEKEDSKGLSKMRAENFESFKALFKAKFGIEPDMH